MKVFVFFFLFFFCFTFIFCFNNNQSNLLNKNNNYKNELDSIILNAISNQVTPGAVGIVGSAQEIFYASALGNYTFGLTPPNNDKNEPVKLDTLYDLASCSKIVGATSAIARIYQEGLIDLNEKVSYFLGEKYASNNKENITVLNCLLHNAGYPPDPNPLYYSKEFNCSETWISENESPHENPKLTFSCQKKIFNSLLEQTLQYKTGTNYIYSDLSFITIMNIVGSVVKNKNLIEKDTLLQQCITQQVSQPNSNHNLIILNRDFKNDDNNNSTFQCYFEAYLRTKIWPSMGMHSTKFLPVKNSQWKDCAPAENSTDFYFKGTWQGQVSDENTYAMGGISGHAGVFSNSLDLIKYARQWLFPSEDSFINKTTSNFFQTDYNPNLSSRALGFNTCNPNAKDECWNFSCGTLSSKTFMHIGYTGTEVCMDPEREIFTILLTNRVYPDATHSASAIHTLRYNFNTQVQKIFDASN